MRRYLSRKRILQITGSVIVFIVLSSASGVIGNAMYSFIIWLWGSLIEPVWAQISKPVAISLLFLLINAVLTLIILAGLIFTIISFKEREKLLYQALDRSNKIVGLDDSLLRLLVRLDPKKDLKNQVQKLLKELLRDTIVAFPDRTETYRAAIFLPNSSKEYLMIRVHVGIPDTSIGRSKFYIGQDMNFASERGIAGTAYVTQQLMVGHITWKKDEWSCNLSSYKQLGKADERPSYNSFVCVPIIADEPEPLGVVCFDSHSSTVFDSDHVQSLLQIFSRRIAAVILVYIILSQSH
jgi:GAF domain